MGYFHTPEDHLEAIEEELRSLYQRQRAAERAREEGRVANYAEWRDAIDRRAEAIRQLERQRDLLLVERQAFWEADDQRQGGPS